MIRLLMFLLLISGTAAAQGRDPLQIQDMWGICYRHQIISLRGGPQFEPGFENCPKILDLWTKQSAAIIAAQRAAGGPSVGMERNPRWPPNPAADKSDIDTFAVGLP